jgi:hypothetical protein
MSLEYVNMDDEDYDHEDCDQEDAPTVGTIQAW